MTIPGSGMDQEKIKQLLELVNEQESIKLKVLYNGVVSSLQAYQKSSTAEHLKDWKAAEKSLKDYVSSLSEMYVESEKAFPNFLAVIDHLQKTGWNCKKSSAYNHKKEGKIKPRADGLFYISDVEKYALAHLKRKDGQKAGDLNDQLQEAKLRAEIKKTEAQAIHWEIRAKSATGEYVRKDFIDNELAARASIFKTDLENFFRSQSAAMVDVAAGAQERVPDFIEYCLAQIEKLLARYSAEGQEFVIEPPPVPNPEPEISDEEGIE